MAFVQWLWVLISHAVFTKRTCTWMYTLSLCTQCIKWTCSLSVLLNLSIAHALAFYSIELVICMYERPLILFPIAILWLGFCTCSALSIHSWCWQLLSCMWSSLMTGALYIPCNMRLTTTFTEKECNSAFHSFSSLFMPRPLSFCSGHLQWIPSLVSND